ncbi:hypothetical protein KAR34_08695 [bacterium]|nr:hypothetical protein [bacterium]
MTWLKTLGRISIVVVTVAVLAGTMGCGKWKTPEVEDKGASDMEKKLEKVVKGLEEKKEPYKGSLTPEKAAAITHEVSAQSMKEFPSGRNLPKDPKKLMALNDRIRKKSEEIYAKHSTSMEEMMRYISGLSPKDREKYNNKLTELFLEQSKKKFSIPEEQKPEVPKAEEKKEKKKK